MSIIINETEFEKAKALLTDAVFKLKPNKKSETDLQKLKLLEFRHNNINFELEIAELICGDDNSFPYRSSMYLSKFFKDLGLNFEHDGSTRRYWVEDILLLLDIHQLSLVVSKGLFNKIDFKKHAKKHNLDPDHQYQKAVEEFKEIISDRLEVNDSVNLSYLLNLNINTELLFDQKTKTNDEKLDELVNEAKDRFRSHKDKQIALEKLWDAFERIKTYFDPGNKKESANKLVNIASEGFGFDIINDESKLLTKIGNDYRIRHHETDKLELSKSKHIDYLFFRMLGLIDLYIKSINEAKQT